MPDNRMKDLRRFYSILDQLEKNIGGERKLADCHRRMDWPERGVYFFKEPGEPRTDTGGGLRIVRVGTLQAGSKTTLWTRLRQHRGSVKTDGGSHRSSVFRKLVGAALIGKNDYKYQSWEQRKNIPLEIRKKEQPLEKEVSQIIGNMPFLWLAIEDGAGTNSLGYFEINSVALLSNKDKPHIDPPSQNWLGYKCDRERVRNSGLWNQGYVDENCDPDFLDKLELLVSRTTNPL